MKSKAVSLAVIAACLWGSEVTVSNAADDPTKMSLEAELALDTVYWRFEGPKAFAIGPNGVWSYYLGGADPEAYALEDCNLRVGTPGGELCFLVALGNDIVRPEIVSGVFLWKGLATDTLPFSTTQMQKSMGKEPNAILVMMPDCLPCVSESAAPLLGSPFAREMTLYSVDFITYFRKKLHSRDAPNETEQDSIRTMKSAVLMTDQTLRMLKSSHPGIPIILWGDGLGGYLAQLVGEKVDGIIVSGGVCMPYYRTAPGVEVRYLYRVSDPRFGWFADRWFANKLDSLSASRDCADAAPSFSTQVIVMPEDSDVPIADTEKFKATIIEILDLIKMPLQ